MSENTSSIRHPIPLAMVGGGPGAFIGPVHRMAAELDGRFRLVAGAFSRDPAKSRLAGQAYGLDPARAYGSYQEMLRAEAVRPDGARLVAVVTPNDQHFPVARAALEAGLHVVSDKPAALDLEEALALKAAVDASGRRFALTYTYTGYPMLRQAREMVARGDLGAVRKVVVEYSQGWLSEPTDTWRLDPARAGLGGCIGDIGVHAFQAAEFVSGLRVQRLCADLSSVVEGRKLDDDCNVLLRFEGGAPGVLTASQIAAGDRNGLRLRVYGHRGGLDWSHESPAVLTVNWLDRPTEVFHAASPYLAPAARAASRLPVGHPEGFIEAFANIYRDMADAIDRGETPDLAPDVDEGVRGMAFVARAIESSRAGTWLSLDGVAQ